MRIAIDKSIGWIIVTVVGLLSAVIAFLVVRAEQWLFDIKSGYCRTRWTKAELFCCPEKEVLSTLHPVYALKADEEQCPDWVTWSDAFGQNPTAHYVVFASIAVRALL